MRVLVACEESQTVCKAFRSRGHEAYSNDIIECSGGHPEWHLKMDALEAVKLMDWDLMIAHPPCTYLSYAATSSWNNPGRLEQRLEALIFFAKLWEAPIDKICIENPMGCASPTIAKYSQVIQPYYFGDSESKRTCLWLKNLPKLIHTRGDTLFEKNTHTKPKVYGYYKHGKKKGCPIYGNNYLKFSEDRGRIRSVFWPGIANAMATQWSENLKLAVASDDGRQGGVKTVVAVNVTQKEATT